jgi:hypothetical protein
LCANFALSLPDGHTDRPQSEWTHRDLILFLGLALMRLPLLQPPIASQSISWGPVWIGFGLGLLVANAWWPVVPVVTAMALVALGATEVTVQRFRGTPRAYLVVVLNLVVYCGLYALFFGATLHQAGVRADHCLGTVAAIDLVSSIWPLSTMLAKSRHALRRC